MGSHFWNFSFLISSFGGSFQPAALKYTLYTRRKIWITPLAQEPSTSSPAKSSILLSKLCFSHSPLLLKVTNIPRKFTEVSRIDCTVMICISYLTCKLLLDSDFFFCILKSGIPQTAEEKAAFTQEPPVEIHLALELSLSCPLHRSVMQILVIARRKIHVALGEKALSEGLNQSRAIMEVEDWRVWWIG